MSGKFLATYSGTGGIVGIVEVTGRENTSPKLFTSLRDPVLVVTKCTRVMLDDRTLNMVNNISEDLDDDAGLIGW